MRAVWLEKHGGPEVLRVVERPDPVPIAGSKLGDTLIDVRACGLNHLDVWVRLGGKRPFPLPLVPGSDAAGVVLEAPADSGLVPGDEVVVYPASGCGRCRACERGDDQLCVAFSIFGASRDGAMAERLVVPARNCLPKPASIDFETAAAVAINYVTAWHMLVARARVRAGEQVLVQAAGSGVSTAAIQIARALGARVLATSSTPEKLAHAERQGAELVVDYREGDVCEAVADWTDGRGVDVVFDHVGAPNWQVDLDCLAKGGRLVFCGTTGGPEVSVDLAVVYFKGQSLLGSTMGTRDELRTILGMIDRGELRPIVDRVFELADLPRAHEYLESQKQVGKVVVRVGDET